MYSSILRMFSIISRKRESNRVEDEERMRMRKGNINKFFHSIFLRFLSGGLAAEEEEDEEDGKRH